MGRKWAATALLLGIVACAGGGRLPAKAPGAPASSAEVTDLLARAQAALAGGRNAEAEPLLARAAGLAPGDDRPLLGLARARLAAADPPGALRHAERAVALRDSAEGRALRGRALARTRQLDAAAAALEGALELAPEDAGSWALLGAVQANRGDRLGAARALSAAAALGDGASNALWRELRFLPPDPFQPEESLDRCTRAYVALLDGQPVEALREAANALRFAPGFHWCAAVRGEALWRSNDPASAEKALRSAIDGFGPRQELLRADAKGVLAELLSTRTDGAPAAAELARASLAARGERAAVLAALLRACEATGDGPCVRDAAARLLKLPGLPDAIRAQVEQRLR
jgi:tetratricopeptide (TPR) repeat protein